MAAAGMTAGAGGSAASARSFTAALVPRVLGIYIAGCARAIQVLDIAVYRLGRACSRPQSTGHPGTRRTFSRQRPAAPDRACAQRTTASPSCTPPPAVMRKPMRSAHANQEIRRIISELEEMLQIRGIR